MAQIVDRLSTTDEIVAIAQRASLYERLRTALKRHSAPQQLPSRLYADLNVYPSQQADFTPKGR